MKITKLKGSNKRSGRCLLKLEGDMTIYNAAAFGECLIEFVEGYKEYEVDLSAVSEIDTAGIQLLLQLKKKAEEQQRTIQLLGCNEEICDLFDLYQLQDWLAPTASTNATVTGA